MKTLRLPTMQDAAILNEDGPCGRHARNALAHQLPQGDPWTVFSPEGHPVAFIDTINRTAFRLTGAQLAEVA